MNRDAVFFHPHEWKKIGRKYPPLLFPMFPLPLDRVEAGSRADRRSVSPSVDHQSISLTIVPDPICNSRSCRRPRSWPASPYFRDDRPLTLPCQGAFSPRGFHPPAVQGKRLRDLFPSIGSPPERTGIFRFADNETLRT